MKLMIIEDEPLMRQGIISKIDWEALQLTLSCEASDGFEALRLLTEYQPDIVLTDVRMPGMTGLQFIGEARSRYPALKFIIISGYDEFEYVREALQHHVKDYLLKPVDPDKLNDLLTEVCAELRAERESASYYAYLEEIGKLYPLCDLRPDDHRHTRFLLEPQLKLAQVPAELLGWPLYCTATAKIATTMNDEKELALARFSVHNVIQNGLLADCGREPAADVVVFNHIYKREEVVVLIGCEHSAMLQEISDQLERLLEWVKARLKINLSIGIGGMKESPYHLAQSYAEAGKRLKNRLLAGDGKLFGRSEITGGHQPAPFTALHEPAKQTLVAMLEEGKAADFADTVIQLMKTALSPACCYEHIEYFYTEVIHLLRSYSRERGVRLPAAFLIAPLTDLEEAADWTGLQAILLNQLQKLADLTTDRFGDRSSDAIIKSVREYVDDHYAADLNLQWVADTYYIHPNYFSKRFKQTTGSSFSDYITSVRMKRAKELLATTSCKINIVAQMVGYDDQNYFCHVFRKAVGVSPSNYRKEREIAD
ncbi:response regulator [Paenibacillus sp. GCM10027626]|uniref:response regulator n=1 Tax=Paenibacillus sp. GCM10027626 TaxID=3273411 RepID=UPI003634FD8C